MPFYAGAAQLYDNLRLLFARIEAENPEATETMFKSRLVFRFRCTDPSAELVIDARGRPLHISYGANNIIHPRPGRGVNHRHLAPDPTGPVIAH